MNDITAVMQRLKTAADEDSYPVLSPDDCRALVEALEARDKQIASWRGLATKCIDGRSEDINQLLDARNRLYELENRDIKLPSLKQTESGERYVWSDGVFNYRSDVIEILRAAGIQVFEGDQK